MVKSVTDLTCDKCHWWVQDDDVETDGECRKNSPSPKITAILDDRKYYTKWPITSEVDFCSEWKLRRE